MSDPFAILRVAQDADDAAIRARYLELVRRYPPEQAPERFAAIRAAYDRVKSRDDRLRWRLFDAGKNETIDDLMEDATCRIPRRRPTLAELLATASGR
jgi:curved DNA-binding protein CbpA